MLNSRRIRQKWDFSTDKEILQGATLEVQYEYTVANESEADYTSSYLIELFENNIGDDYNELLKIIALGDPAYGVIGLKKKIQQKQDEGNVSNKGTYLGQYYYTGDDTLADGFDDVLVSGDVAVEIRVDKIQEYVNNELVFNTLTEDSSDFEKNTTLGNPTTGRIITNNTAFGTGVLSDTQIDNLKIELRKNPITSTDIDVEDIDINAVVDNKDPSTFLKTSEETLYHLFLTKVLAPEAIAEDMNYESYIAEIMGYSVSTGRRDMDSIPGNLLYRHSENTDIDLEDGLNEPDETWAETINIHQPFR